MTISELIAAHSITMTATSADRNPHMDDSDNMDHWRCVIRCGGRRMTVVYSMGYGHNGAEPELADVLDTLASDAAGYDNATGFAGWASEYGYDTDSRRAERVYRTVGTQAGKLRRLLGDDAYNSLLFDCERI